ncbi:hypothetical protein LCGC14_2121640 [marine sediment metagenome]|uniref:Uncharacterized protein n=1 Tax=marine sediment metagenome TaxID=412755 RepID=A0A0F9GH88_9ZZZZ
MKELKEDTLVVCIIAVCITIIGCITVICGCEGPIGSPGVRGPRGLTGSQGVAIDSHEYILHDTEGANWMMEITDSENYFSDVWIRRSQSDNWSKLSHGISYYQNGNYVIIYYKQAYIDWYCKITFME